MTGITVVATLAQMKHCRHFSVNFAGISDLAVEPVYTGKLFYALFDLIEKGAICPGTEIVAIHSGGFYR